MPAGVKGHPGAPLHLSREGRGGSQACGRRLQDRRVDACEERERVSEREEALLDLAARQARDIGALEADISTRGYLVSGSRGQKVLNSSIAQLRQSRLALGKLLGQLDLPESTRDAVRGARRPRRGR